MIPICDLKQQYLPLKEEIDAVMQEVAASGHYILGPQVRAFEQEMADYCGCQYAIGVGSGTDALHLALLALGIGPGDEVITTPFTFIATTEAIGMVGATPVFVDIDPQTFNIDVEQIESAITSRTKAILPVHLYGQPCEMEAISALANQYSLRVVEDAAQALGATYQGQKVGAFGTAGCFSFFPSKNLGCFGDGGMVVTNDKDVHDRVEMLRRHGGKVKYHHSELGLNSRLDALQAAILRIKLPHLDSWNQSRRNIAYRYNQLL
ncbi:MAG: DegT/DnrJ/EryC1/StrS family aminotransferase, partial [Gammaproteobacteria bacterium]|nr:DegT/DnrJ/EryC1/StrS family aminotransferase [Gammaproteobacteria bacterium]